MCRKLNLSIVEEYYYLGCRKLRNEEILGGDTGDWASERLCAPAESGFSACGAHGSQPIPPSLTRLTLRALTPRSQPYQWGSKTFTRPPNADRGI